MGNPKIHHPPPDPSASPIQVTTREDMMRNHALWLREQPNAHVIIVCGGRDYPHRDRVFTALDKAHAKKPITVIVHGACKRKGSQELSGADRWADEWARERKVWVQQFPADWGRHGFAAGPIRNQEMVDAGAHGCVAFPSRGTGTADCVRRCEAAGIRVWHPFAE